LGARRSSASPTVYVTLLFFAFVVFVFVPTHALLQALYGVRH